MADKDICPKKYNLSSVSRTKLVEENRLPHRPLTSSSHTLVVFFPELHVVCGLYLE